MTRTNSDYDAIIPDYTVIEEMDKDALIRMAFMLADALKLSMRLNDDYSDTLWHWEQIYNGKGKLFTSDHRLDSITEHLVKESNELNARYDKEKMNDSKEEHDS